MWRLCRPYRWRESNPHRPGSKPGAFPFRHSGVVPPRGFEPLTPGLEARRSTSAELRGCAYRVRESNPASNMRRPYRPGGIPVPNSVWWLDRDSNPVLQVENLRSYPWTIKPWCPRRDSNSALRGENPRSSPIDDKGPWSALGACPAPLLPPPSRSFVAGHLPQPSPGCAVRRGRRFAAPTGFEPAAF